MLEKFTVIDLIKTRSSSVCTVSGNFVKFNTQTAQELNYPAYVQFLVDGKSKQFAIRICKAEAPSSVAFSKPEGQQRYPIRINNAAITTMLRKLMGWGESESWNVPGIYLAEENALLYSLEAAYAPKPKGGWAAKRAHEAAAAEAEEALNHDQTAYDLDNSGSESDGGEIEE